jgi:hypothetical protein
MYKIFLKNKYFYNFMIIIFLIISFNFFQKLNKIVNMGYDHRLTQIYGYCYPQGYGFIKEVKKKYKLRNIKTINFDDFAQSDFFLDNPNYKYLKEYKILINYDPSGKNSFLLDGYKILYNKEKCFLIKNG